jgi:hypothetical protein
MSDTFELKFTARVRPRLITRRATIPAVTVTLIS